MEFFRLPFPDDPSFAFEHQGLIVEEMALKKYPSGRHWHLRRAGKPGTLEVTWVDGVVWAEVRSNRQGVWTAVAAALLQAKLTD